MKQHGAITPTQQRALRAMVAMGCDHEMGAKALGVTPEELDDLLSRDPQFAQELWQAEGQAEFHHMRTLHAAAKDEKYWRAATWWLERRAKRYASRPRTPQLSPALLDQYLETLAEILLEEVRDPAVQRRVLARLADLLTEDSGTGPLAGMRRGREEGS